MRGIKLIAVLLIAAGVLGLMYGGFTYSKTTQEAHVGSLELSVKEDKTVNIPLWAGIAAVVAGGALLFVKAAKI
jgi:TRAP-type C4-dicarboxylate transport system permease small subunit